MKDTHFGKEMANWYRAYENCRELGSELVTFEASREFDAVNWYLKNKDVRSNHWTSGNDLAHTGIHNWFTNAKLIDINRWAPTQSNNRGGEQHCVHMCCRSKPSKDFRLNDKSCKGSSMKYVWELPVQGSTPFIVGK
ncbi:C-type lectin 37Da-like [Drosophila biarmipes]|uniref:C-type lectin 37Da-like n=1 Tax=Drosophila biarmipes TaxID=125945 RepID=UPI0021CC78C2|nr:C-type lectin 37Da-like [Drosophila biarmipes]